MQAGSTGMGQLLHPGAGVGLAGRKRQPLAHGTSEFHQEVKTLWGQPSQTEPVPKISVVFLGLSTYSRNHNQGEGNRAELLTV